MSSNPKPLKFLTWLFLLGIVTVLIIALSIYRRKDSELQRFLVKALEKKYPQLRFEVGSAVFVEGRGVSLRSLRVWELESNSRPFFEVAEVFAECPLSLKSLLYREVKLTRLVFKEPLYRHEANRSIKELIEKIRRPIDIDRLCPIDVENGKLIFPGSEQQHTEVLHLGGIALTILPPGRLLADGQISPNWQVRGNATNSHVRNIEWEGELSWNLTDWQCWGTGSNLDISPEFTRHFVSVETSREMIDSFQGRTSFSFFVRRDPEQIKGYRLRLEGELFRGSVTLPLFRHPVSEIYARYWMSEAEFCCERLTGHSGQTLILADYRRSLDQNDLGIIHAQLEEMPLDNELISSLIPSDKIEGLSVLDQFVFSTTAKINLVLEPLQGKWHPSHLIANCRQLSFCFDKFPYRLQNLRGTLSLDKEEKIQFKMEGADEVKSILIEGLFTNVFREPQGEIAIRGQGYPMDEKLFKALPDSCRSEIVRLHPNGLIDLELVIRHQQVEEKPKTETSLQIGVRNGSLRYELFPYRIAGITGVITQENGVWSFKNMQGKAGTSDIRGTCALGPDAMGVDRLSLQIQALGLALDDQLRVAIERYPQYELIQKLNARGKVNANINIQYLVKTKEFNLEFEANPLPEVTSIRPEMFPYELKQLQGLIVYRKGELVIDNLRGQNGQTTYHSSIYCRFLPDGSCLIDVPSFHIDQLLMDRELQGAVPNLVLNFFDQLKLKGYFNLSGGLRLWRQAGMPLEVALDVGVVLQQNTADWKTPIKNISGRTRLRGLYVENKSLQLHGELDLDSLFVQGIQATQATGPFFFDGHQVFLGRAVPLPLELALYQNEFLRTRLLSDPVFQTQEQQRASAIASNQEPLYNDTMSAARRPLQAQLNGGNLLLSGGILCQEIPSWQISFLLQDAQANEMARDFGKADQTVNGKITLYSNLKGQGQHVGTIEGDGGLILSDARLYELPQILKIFQLLSIQEPDKEAFNSSHIDFRVFGKRLRLERVFLEGNALMLLGEGWLTLEEHGQQLDLTMNARLGNSKSQIPVISDVMGGAGDQIAQIRVQGSLSDPYIWADRFPGIKKAWWIFSGQNDTTNGTLH